MTDPVNTDALRDAYVAQSKVAAYLLFNELPAESEETQLRANLMYLAADEVDRLRHAIDHMVPDYTLPQHSRIMRDRERLRKVIADAPHDSQDGVGCGAGFDPVKYPCTCWKKDAL